MMGDNRMAAEVREASEAVARQAGSVAPAIEALARALARRPPQVVVTCARGSSAHAATFGKHLIERYLGVPVAAAAPSIATVYRRELALKDQLFLAVSQSGRSDDLVEQAEAARRAGALTVAVVNETASPLAAACEVVLAMEAGPEQSVAATKTFVASAALLARLAAAWAGDDGMLDALSRLPERLDAAHRLDWSAALANLAEAGSLVAIGRGPTLAMAREAALKLKETCRLHAEAFSGAEFMHGPVTLVGERFPILLFVPGDEARSGLVRLGADLRAKGATVLAAEPGPPHPGRLPVLEPDHAETDAIVLIQAFYAMAVRLAQQRGLDVDRPRHLQKVTRTR